MFLSKDDWISQRAYALWESEGRPEGRGDDHWQQAAREHQLLELTKASADGSDMIERLRAMGRLMREIEAEATPLRKAAKRSIAR
jgi:hypothetical protein